MKLAAWRCTRCGSKRDLEVHHKTYAHLGCESDADLDVLCGDCHEKHHGRSDGPSSVRIYLKLASDLLEQGARTVADLSEALKVRCGELRIPYDGDRIQQAMAVLATRLPDVDLPGRTFVAPPLSPERPISKAEAQAVMARMFDGYPLAKTMPRVDPSVWMQEEDPYIENPGYINGSQERY